MLILIFLAGFLPATLAVNCYVCNWSPKDQLNRTATCSDEFFMGNAAGIRPDCVHGCQTYTHMDKNGAIEQVRRSCLQNSEKMTGDCVTEENKAFTSKTCTCNYNLCNTASSLYTSSIVFLVVTAVALKIFSVKLN